MDIDFNRDLTNFAEVSESSCARGLSAMISVMPLIEPRSVLITTTKTTPSKACVTTRNLNQWPNKPIAVILYFFRPGHKRFAY